MHATATPSALLLLSPRSSTCVARRRARDSRLTTMATAVSPAAATTLRTYRLDALSPAEHTRLMARPRVDFGSIMDTVRAPQPAPCPQYAVSYHHAPGPTHVRV